MTDGLYYASDYTAVQNGVQVAGLNAKGAYYNRGLNAAMLPPSFINGGKYKTGSIVPIKVSSAGVDMGSNALDSTDSLRQKYGFRFLYNPSSVATSTALNNSIAAADDSPFAYMANMQTLSFQVFLNRVMDVDDPNGVKNGTLHDIEFLYRVINGPPANISEMGSTSDIGMIMPNPVKVIFGPKFMFTGYVNSVSITHQMFQKDMVPTLSTVDISLTRTFGDVQNLWSGPGGASGDGSASAGSDTPASAYAAQQITPPAPTTPVPSTHGYGGGNY